MDYEDQNDVKKKRLFSLDRKNRQTWQIVQMTWCQTFAVFVKMIFNIKTIVLAFCHSRI